MCNGVHDILTSKTRPYTSSAAPRMIDTYFRPSPTHGFTVYITQRSRPNTSSPIPWALYHRPPSPAPSRVRPRDVTPLGFSHRDREKSRVACAPIVKLTEDLRFFKKIPLDRKLQADSKNGVQIENQAKNDQVMGPQKGLIFEKNLFYPKLACL